MEFSQFSLCCVYFQFTLSLTDGCAQELFFLCLKISFLRESQSEIENFFFSLLLPTRARKLFMNFSSVGESQLFYRFTQNWRFQHWEALRWLMLPSLRFSSELRFCFFASCFLHFSTMLTFDFRAARQHRNISTTRKILINWKEIRNKH